MLYAWNSAGCKRSAQQAVNRRLALSFVFILHPTVWDVEPVVTHQTFWLESTVSVQLSCWHSSVCPAWVMLCQTHASMWRTSHRIALLQLPAAKKYVTLPTCRLSASRHRGWPAGDVYLQSQLCHTLLCHILNKACCTCWNSCCCILQQTSK